MRTEDLSSSSVNFPCRREIFRQLPLTFCAAGTFSVNFRHLFVPPGDLLPLSINFRVARTPSVNFNQISVWPGDLPSSSVNFPYHQENA